MYVSSGCTHKDRLLGNVQGVVVQATNATFGSSSSGKFTMTTKSLTQKFFYGENDVICVFFAHKTNGNQRKRLDVAKCNCTQNQC